MERQRRKLKPGFMVYHEIRQAIHTLSDEDAGKLFKAAVDYSEDGTLPESLSGASEVLWAVMRVRIDADAENYRQKSRDRQYAAYVRDQSKTGQSVMDKSTWEVLNPE